MAKSYLGKISALVTANTSDFNRKLDESAQRTRSFAASVKSQINAAERAASKSLDGIYTSLQKVERALSAASGRRLSLIDEREANKIRQLASAAEEVYRPLERAAKASEKLGADVRANFQPALIAAQKSAEALNRVIESGGSVGAASYGRVRRQVELTAEAIDRLSEAQSSLGGLATGRELRFQSPGLVTALDAARREQERAAKISPVRAQQLGIGAIQGRQFLAAQRAAEANALVEDARLNVARRPDSARFQQDLQAATQLAREADAALETVTDELRQQLNIEERLVAAREREVALIQQAGAASKRATPVADYIRQRVEEDNRRREAQLIQNQGAVSRRATPIGGLLNLRRAEEEESSFRARAADEAEREAQATARLVELLNRASAVERERRSGALARQNSQNFDDATAGLLTASQPRVDLFAQEQRTIQTELARTAELRSQFFALPPDVQRSLEDERRAINNTANAARDGAAGIGTLELANNRMAAAIDEANRSLNEQRTVAIESADALERRARLAMGGDIPGGDGDLGGRLESARQVDNVTGRVAALRQQIDQLPDGLRGAFIPALQQVNNEVAELNRSGFEVTVGQIQAATSAVNRLDSELSRASTGLNFGRQFGGAGTGGIEFGLQEASLRSYTAQLQILQRAIAGVSSEARGPAVASFNRLRSAIAAFAAAGEIDTSQARREVAALTAEAVRAAAAVSGIGQARLGRSLARAGDVGRAGFDNFTLGVQQALFAVDDFFSVTGGFEQRIRAISNNISQLGFVIGGTSGLFAALGVTIGAQAVLYIRKYIFEIETAEDKQKRLKASTESLNSSFEGQKSIVESLAKSYKGLADDIRAATLPEQSRTAIARRDKVNDIRRDQQNARRELLATTVPQIADLRDRRRVLEESLANNASDIAAQADIRRQIADNRRQEDAIVAVFEANAADRVRRRDAQLNPATQRVFADAALNDIRERNKLLDAGVAPTDRNASLAENARIAGELAVGLQQVKDAAVITAIELSGPLSDAISEAQSEIQSLGGFVDDNTRIAVSRAGKELADLVAKAASGAANQGQVRAEITRIRQNVGGARDVLRDDRLFRNQFEAQQREIDRVNQEAEASAQRGKDLGSDPGKRAADAIGTGLEDIRRAFGKAAEETTGLVDFSGLRDAQRRFVEESLRSTAPAIFALSDQVQNAVLQGPSRAALQASDVTTSQGAAELNRLLRGDDQARNQNLVELRVQSGYLADLVQIARRNGAPPGVLDL